jgi:hypothetical protein
VALPLPGSCSSAPTAISGHARTGWPPTCRSRPPVAYPAATPTAAAASAYCMSDDATDPTS